MKWIYKLLTRLFIVLSSNILSAASIETSPNLIVENNCSYDIWVQQDSKNSVPNSPELVYLKKNNGSYTYNIPKAGLASTRFWPKAGCDDNGINCSVGNSQIVSSLKKLYKKDFQFSPPIDSKFEATWGCYKGQKCITNPSSKKKKPLQDVTWWDGSVVDGYTLPYAILLSDKNGNFSNNPVNNVKVYCGNLDPNNCPTKSDLSSGGINKIINNINLTNINLSWNKNDKPIGCFSPCSKLTTSQGSATKTNLINGGLASLLGVKGPASKVAVDYCCPTPPVTSSQCSNGPATTNAYTIAVKQQRCNSYTYAYDDAASLGVVPVSTKFKVIFCPSSNLEKAIPKTKVQFTASKEGLKNLNNTFFNSNNIKENTLYEIAEGDIIIDKSGTYKLKTCSFKLTFDQSLKVYKLNSIPSVGNGEFCNYLTTKYIDGINIVTINNTKKYVNPGSKFTFRVGLPDDISASIDNAKIISGENYKAQNFLKKSILTISNGAENYNCNINFNQKDITLDLNNSSPLICRQLSINQLPNTKIEYIGVPDFSRKKIALSDKFS